VLRESTDFFPGSATGFAVLSRKVAEIIFEKAESATAARNLRWVHELERPLALVGRLSVIQWAVGSIAATGRELLHKNPFIFRFWLARAARDNSSS